MLLKEAGPPQKKGIDKVVEFMVLEGAAWNGSSAGKVTIHINAQHQE